MPDFLRSKDGDIKKNFTKVPNQLWHLYTRLPGFDARHVALYTILLDKFNDSKGYAWPSEYTLSELTGFSRGTIEKWVDILERYGLIKTIPKDAAHNYLRYKLAVPLDDPEFTDIFRPLLGKYEDHAKRTMGQADADKKRLNTITDDSVDLSKYL